MKFFDTYPDIGGQDGRMQEAYKAIFEDNLEIFDGASVLVAGCTEPAWLVASLHAGAKFVTCVEPEPKHFLRCADFMNKHEMPRNQYRLVQEDVCRALGKMESDIYDIALVVGLLHRTPRHYDILRCLNQVNPKHMIIAAKILREVKPVIKFRQEGKPQRMVGIMSRSCLVNMVKWFGYNCKFSNWEDDGTRSKIGGPAKEDAGSPAEPRVTMLATRVKRVAGR